MNNSHPKVTIIIAVYNCEMYFEKCVRSLFEQTLDKIEYVFINDATPDHSIDILKRIIGNYPTRNPFVKIINLETNSGVSNARKIGIEQASGEYIIHADSDDWVDIDMYKRLYLKAKATNADIVGCNFKHVYSDYQYDFRQQYADTMEENIRRLINGRIFPSLCTSLTRKSLIDENGIAFPVGLNMGEDLYFNLQLYLHAKKIVSMDWAPYHYRHTEDSSCVQKTRKSIDSDIAIAGLIEKYMKEHQLYENYSQDIEYRKFLSKLPLINDFNIKDNYHDWLDIYPETNKHIWGYKQLDWKQKLGLWFAANKMFPVAKGLQNFLEWQHRIRRP